MRIIIFIALMFIPILWNKIYAQEGVILDVLGLEQSVYYDKEKHNSTYIGTLDDGLGALMSLNVFGYYDLYRNYNSELKRKVFLESEEGKKLLNELKKKKW